MRSVCPRILYRQKVRNLVRYGIIKNDYTLENEEFIPLVDGKKPENADMEKQTYVYRARFSFLLNALGDEGESEDAAKNVVKAKGTLLPIDELIAANEDKNLLKKLNNEVKNEFKQSGKEIDKLIQTRNVNYYRMIEYLQQDINAFDLFVKTQNPEDKKTLQNFYAEVFKRMRK